MHVQEREQLRYQEEKQLEEQRAQVGAHMGQYSTWSCAIGMEGLEAHAGAGTSYKAHHSIAMDPHPLIYPDIKSFIPPARRWAPA